MGPLNGGSNRPTVVLGGLGAELGAWLQRRLPAVAVLEAGTGRAVLGAVGAGEVPPRLLVLDESLIEPPAFEVVRRVRGGRSVVVVYCLSAQVGTALGGESAAAAGVDRLLFHPLDREEFAREVAAALGQPLPGVSTGVTGVTGAAGVADAMADRLRTLWAKAREPTLQRVTTIEDAAVAAVEDRLTAAAHEDARRAAHQVAGSAGTYGFPEASRLARDCERLLESRTGLGRGEILRLSELVVGLRDALADPAGSQAEADTAAGERRPRLLCVSADGRVADALARAAEQLPAETVVAEDLLAARETLLGAAVDLALVDLGVPDAAAVVADLARREPPVPAVAVDRGAPTSVRLEAARAGVHGFVAASATAAELADRIDGVLQRSRGDRPTVLAIDDDPHALESIARVLGDAGMRVVGIGDPLRCLDALEAARPDLLVLDAEMPLVSGYEVCRLIRRDPRWATVPVLFLSSLVGPEPVQRMFSVGADDYVAKPVVGPELLNRITNRLERTRLHRELADTDPLTGVGNRRSSSARFEDLLRLSRRYGQPLTLAVLDLDHFKSVNDRHGHAVGDAVLRRLAHLLRQNFRGEDVVARWGGEEFLVAMYGMDRAGGKSRMDGLRGLFATEQAASPDAEDLAVTFSVGLAQFPADAQDAEGLYRAADRALYQAKVSGRDRVCSTDTPDPEPAVVADVLVVDDDDVLSDLLCHALETRGLGHERAADGQQALALLVGPPPRLRARVVLLDVDLPRVSGFDVLRRMSSAGILRRTRVVMLTARSAEREVLDALEHGAFDHVSKPFSVPVLMERVQRALQA